MKAGRDQVPPKRPWKRRREGVASAIKIERRNVTIETHVVEELGAHLVAGGKVVVKHRPREDGCRKERDEGKSAQSESRPLPSAKRELTFSEPLLDVLHELEHHSMSLLVREVFGFSRLGSIRGGFGSVGGHEVGPVLLEIGKRGREAEFSSEVVECNGDGTHHGVDPASRVELLVRHIGSHCLDQSEEPVVQTLLLVGFRRVLRIRRRALVFESGISVRRILSVVPRVTLGELGGSDRDLRTIVRLGFLKRLDRWLSCRAVEESWAVLLAKSTLVDSDDSTDDFFGDVPFVAEGDGYVLEVVEDSETERWDDVVSLCESSDQKIC